jgi:hypothetical protein
MQTNRTGNVTLAFRPAGLRILLIVQTDRLGILLILKTMHQEWFLLILQTNRTRNTAIACWPTGNTVKHANQEDWECCISLQTCRTENTVDPSDQEDWQCYL